MRSKLGIMLLIIVLLLPWWAPVPGETRVLQRGMGGTDVEELQALLVELGHDLAVDGIFGEETEALVMQIQGGVGITVDGIVGEQTSKVLEQLKQSVLTHTVEWGDNLTKLADLYETTVSNISDYNLLSNPDWILPGQVLYIPITDLAVLSRSVVSRIPFQWPLQGKISSGYGYRIHPITKVRHFHGGIDIAAPEGTPVRAAASGKVIKAGPHGNFGLTVVLEHPGGITSWYGHNSQINVRVGEQVNQGQIISRVGQTGMATGPHLDFRIKIGDQTVDPLEWLP